jgi:septal ring factor EnvC (AmiA/AmiB activator)
VSEEHPTVKDLEWLIETEARLDGLLQAARAEAGDVIAQARDRIARAEERRAADYEAARRDLERQVAQERDHELTRIRDEAERLTAHYATQSPEQVEALAVWVASSLHGPTAREAAP